MRIKATQFITWTHNNNQLIKGLVLMGLLAAMAIAPEAAALAGPATGGDHN
ncbi:MAG: hypothetical protein ACLFTK_00270 [Anaerolineales bacterium]